MAEKEPAKREEVTLKEVHTHGGEKKKPKDKIMVSPAQKKWLEDRNLI